MIRASIAILLVSAFLLQSVSKLLIVGNYAINKEFIAKNLCENKAKPKMHCNGKCHLKKQLAKQEKKENTPANNIKTKAEFQLFSEFKTVLPSKKISNKTQAHFTYLFSVYDSYLSSVFHPPSC